MLNPSQEYKEQLVNELIRLTSVASVPVISRIVTTPPTSGLTPDSYYIVPTGATGAWEGKTNQIAFPLIGLNGQPNGDWGFWLPFLGIKVSLVSGDNLFFNGTNWQTVTGAGDMLVAEYGGSAAGIVAKADEIAGNPNNDTFYGKESGVKGFFGFFSKVLSTPLTALSTSTGGAITATDTLLISLGKIQNQINNINPSANVLTTVLTGLSTTTGGAITTTDNVLQGFGKLQKQLNDLNITGVTDGDKGDVAVSNSGTTWTVETGTTANSIVRLDSAAKLPAIDGSQLTNLPTGGGGTGVTDGDKGDITVSNSGTTWTIDNQSVTYSKLQQTNSGNIALGKPTNGNGTITEIPIGVEANNLIRLDNTAKLPAVDGSQLTNLPVLSASQIRDSLATLTGGDRLDASAIKNLPTGGGGSSEDSWPITIFALIANDPRLEGASFPKTLTLPPFPVGVTINKVSGLINSLSSGSAVISIQNDTTNISGLNSLNCTTTVLADQLATANNILSAGGRLRISFSSITGLINISFRIDYTENP